ncbi:DUF937 domain-containing protein [Aerobium aerolatum]|uniref:DUF937 domain-containing protein n=1 Tax=Aquamicrobium aerolatum DSM 21857 TaxID=1121003 RepID=A0A1I3JQ23_9HYPH|nr:DUF937 domain-containing protein [Aquamicrobium aerolatum]SFI62343.1 hypothetical protein SAMN03080618_00950 [Aquamicrobium aerolatum DSM 21857]
MSSLFDMLAGAQNGNALNQIARQFNLSQQQAQDAMEALLPAFSQGLKRNAATPNDLGSFLSALASGQHAKYYEDASNAFSSQGLQDGNGILGHLFGSKDLSRAVAQQASQATGIGQDILKQMLPVLASMIMGGLFKQSTGQTQQAAQSANPLQQIIEQMMRGGMGQAQQSQPQAGQTPFENPLGKMLEGMFGGGQPRPQSRDTQQPPLNNNPLGRIFEEMLGAGAQNAAPKPAPAPKANPSGRARSPYDDLFGDMFESGAKTRDNYQQGMESIFDQFLQGMKKR